MTIQHLFTLLASALLLFTQHGPAIARDVSTRSPLCPYLSETHNPELRTVYYGTYKMRTCYNQVHEGEYDEDGGLLYANPAVVEGLTDPRAANGIHFHAHASFERWLGFKRSYKFVDTVTIDGVTFEVWGDKKPTRAMVWYSNDLQAIVNWQFSELQEDMLTPKFSEVTFVTFTVAWKDSTCIRMLPTYQSRTFGFDGNVVDFIADIRRVTDWAYLGENE